MIDGMKREKQNVPSSINVIKPVRLKRIFMIDKAFRKEWEKQKPRKMNLSSVEFWICWRILISQVRFLSEFH